MYHIISWLLWHGMNPRARTFLARHGTTLFWHGLAWPGTARKFLARRTMARHDTKIQGTARRPGHGTARRPEMGP